MLLRKRVFGKAYRSRRSASAWSSRWKRWPSKPVSLILFQEAQQVIEDSAPLRVQRRLVELADLFDLGQQARHEEVPRRVNHLKRAVLDKAGAHGQALLARLQEHHGLDL